VPHLPMVDPAPQRTPASPSGLLSNRGDCPVSSPGKSLARSHLVALLAGLVLLLALATPAGANAARTAGTGPARTAGTRTARTDAARTAAAGAVTKILTACSEGRVPSGYSQQDYHQALKQMSPTLSEYTSCSNLIQKAQLASAAGKGGGSGGLGGPGAASAAATPPPTPSEQHTLEGVRHTGSTPVEVGGETIHPGVVHANIDSALSTLPTPLLALLAFLLACVLAMCGSVLHNRVRGRRDSS
jgi:hypothetical protein